MASSSAVTLKLRIRIYCLQEKLLSGGWSTSLYFPAVLICIWFGLTAVMNAQSTNALPAVSTPSTDAPTIVSGFFFTLRYFQQFLQNSLSIYVSFSLFGYVLRTRKHDQIDLIFWSIKKIRTMPEKTRIEHTTTNTPSVISAPSAMSAPSTDTSSVMSAPSTDAPSVVSAPRSTVNSKYIRHLPSQNYWWLISFCSCFALNYMSFIFCAVTWKNVQLAWREHRSRFFLKLCPVWATRCCLRCNRFVGKFFMRAINASWRQQVSSSGRQGRNQRGPFHARKLGSP